MSDFFGIATLASASTSRYARDVHVASSRLVMLARGAACAIAIAVGGGLSACKSSQPGAVDAGSTPAASHGTPAATSGNAPTASLAGACGSGEQHDAAAHSQAGEAAPGATAGVGAAGASAQGGAPAASGGASMAAGSGGSSQVAADAGVAGGKLPQVTSVDGDGPFQTMQDLASGPGQASGVFFPAELGKNGLRHPVFLFGCGGGSNPAQYATELSRVASHGFVVLADVANIGDDANVFKKSLEWLIGENTRMQSPFFGKLDTSRVAAGGHSIGSVNAFLFAPDPRLTATIHVAGGSLDNVNDPSSPTTGKGGKALIHPALFLCGDTDIFGNIEKLQTDFSAATAPVAFTTVVGSDHVGVYRDGLPAIVAFLRWQLGGETERRSMFLDASGEFRSGMYMTQSKNF